METSILIVGGGPVGMALGLVLDRCGVDHVIVERNPTTTTHPKSRGCTARTMENFRVWGIEDRIRAGGLPPEADALWSCETATGRVHAVGRPEPMTHQMPAPKCMVAQDVVEAALADVVEPNRHTQFLRQTELVSFDQDADGVTARVRSCTTGEEREVRTRYLIGCDGSGSRVRKAVGIEMEGPELLARLANYYYRADVSHFPYAGKTFCFSVSPPDPHVPTGVGILATGPKSDRWLWVQILEHDDQPLYGEDELVPIVRAHWGIPDLEVELLGVMTWRMSAQIPTAFRRGRVILAGDAAHRFPPAGGMGLNSGIQDAQNLGWKLALVARGLAPDRLLDTYEAERRPVALSNCAWSTGNVERMPRTAQAFQNRETDVAGFRQAQIESDNHLHSSGQAMGHIYERGAVVDDGSPVPPHDARYYWPTDRPGARFPHMWLDTACTRSTIDWFDDRAFTLVCGPRGGAWATAAAAVAETTRVPLRARALPFMAGPFTFPDDGAVLVRPDGHVGWRPGPDAGAGDEASALGEALDRIVRGGTEADGHR